MTSSGAATWVHHVSRLLELVMLACFQCLVRLLFTIFSFLCSSSLWCCVCDCVPRLFFTYLVLAWQSIPMQGGWGDPTAAACSVALPTATQEALLILLSTLWYCLDSSRWPWLTTEAQPPLVHARVRRSLAAVVFRLVRPQVGNLVALLRRMILQFIDAPLLPSVSPSAPLPAGPKTALVVLTTALSRILTLHTTILAPLVLSSSTADNGDVTAPASWWDPAADATERTRLLAELAPPKLQPPPQAPSMAAASGTSSLCV
jgi:hypothetical protein